MSIDKVCNVPQVVIVTPCQNTRESRSKSNLPIRTLQRTQNSQSCNNQFAQQEAATGTSSFTRRCRRLRSSDALSKPGNSPLEYRRSVSTSYELDTSTNNRPTDVAKNYIHKRLDTCINKQGADRNSFRRKSSKPSYVECKEQPADCVDKRAPVEVSGTLSVNTSLVTQFSYLPRNVIVGNVSNLLRQFTEDKCSKR